MFEELEVERRGRKARKRYARSRARLFKDADWWIAPVDGGSQITRPLIYATVETKPKKKPSGEPKIPARDPRRVIEI